MASPSACLNPACTEAAGTVQLRKCMGCGELGYCGKACQQTDWPRHKTDCKKQAKKEERPQRPESEALTHQKTMLAGGNSEFDYFLYSNEDNVDFGIKISDPRARVFFTICKQRADKGSLRAVQHMFNLLVDTAAEAGVEQDKVREQLTSEWGNFMGPEAMAEPELNVDEDEVRRVMMDLAMTVDEMEKKEPLY